jgi:hypothetical protein
VSISIAFGRQDLGAYIKTGFWLGLLPTAFFALHFGLDCGVVSIIHDHDGETPTFLDITSFCQLFKVPPRLFKQFFRRLRIFCQYLVWGR